MWYGVMNGGNASGGDVLVEWKSANPLSGWTFLGTILTNSESWCTGNEIQDPTLLPSATGAYWILHYSCAATAQEGIAFSSSPTGPFTPWAGNPIVMNGVGDTNLGTMWIDSGGDPWILSTANDKPGIWLSEGQQFSTVVGAAAASSPSFIAHTTGAYTGYQINQTYINTDKSTPMWQWMGSPSNQYFSYLGGGSANNDFVAWPSGNISIGGNSPTSTDPGVSLKVIGSNGSIRAAHLLEDNGSYFTLDKSAVGDQQGTLSLGTVALLQHGISPGYTANLNASTLSANRYYQLADNANCTSASPCTVATLQSPVFTGTVSVPNYTVATLPSCGSGQRGEEAAVTDAASPTYLGTLTGNGTAYTPVICNGTAWISY